MDPASVPTSDDRVVGSGAFRYRVDPRWSIPCDRRYGEIPGVACDSRDRVYLFARGTRTVHIFERDGTPFDAWSDNRFARPHGIFIGPDDTIYCTDDFDHSVRAFNRDGKPLFTLGTPGQPSDTGVTGMDYRTIQRAAGPFNYPTNLAIAPNGDLYVSDGYGNARIHHFSPSGQLLNTWGEPGPEPGQFHVPHGIAIDGAGIVYIADRENSRIQRFTTAGGFIDQWLDVARPCQVFIAGDGLVYVAELGFHAGRWPGTGAAQPDDVGARVSIFDTQGVLQARFGGGADPCAAGDFFAAHDIWVDSQGSVYVGEVTYSAGARTGRVPMSCHTVQKFIRQD